MKAGTSIVVCTYTAKPGQATKLEGLLRQHWPTLQRLGLATTTPAVLMRGQPAEPEAHGAGGKYIEMFSWKDENSMKLAHESPDVMAVWEGIGTCCSSMEFPGYTVFA